MQFDDISEKFSDAENCREHMQFTYNCGVNERPEDASHYNSKYDTPPLRCNVCQFKTNEPFQLNNEADGGI